MYDAQYMITKSEAGIELYSPWFSRGGAHARFTVDLVQVEDASLQITALTKNTEVSGDGGTTLVTSSLFSTTGQHPFVTTSPSADELVRFVFKCSANGDGDPGFVLFRMLTIVWFDGVLAP